MQPMEPTRPSLLLPPPPPTLAPMMTALPGKPAKKQSRNYLQAAKGKVILRKEPLLASGIGALTDDEAKLYIRAINTSMEVLDSRRIAMPSKGFSLAMKKEAIRNFFAVADIDQFTPG